MVLNNSRTCEMQKAAQIRDFQYLGLIRRTFNTSRRRSSSKALQKKNEPFLEEPLLLKCLQRQKQHGTPALQSRRNNSNQSNRSPNDSHHFKDSRSTLQTHWYSGKKIYSAVGKLFQWVLNWCLISSSKTYH